jgi:hypothetical protein
MSNWLLPSASMGCSRTYINELRDSKIKYRGDPRALSQSNTRPCSIGGQCQIGQSSILRLFSCFLRLFGLCKCLCLGRCFLKQEFLLGLLPQPALLWRKTLPPPQLRVRIPALPRVLLPPLRLSQLRERSPPGLLPPPVALRPLPSARPRSAQGEHAGKQQPQAVPPLLAPPRPLA